jgi:hypothetical protein
MKNTTIIYYIYYMVNTLVIILSETRASELTFDSFKKNVIDVLDADLCLCIGIKPDYDYTNPFFVLSKYNFLYDEPDDFGSAFDYAYNLLQIKEKEDALHWREFLKLKDQFLGGIKDETHQHEGSAGILLFFRWFLLKNLIEHDLIHKYDRFVITRSDFIYQLPHPKVEQMAEPNLWIPDCEYYDGYTDRHVVLSRTNIEPYLNILNHIVLRSNEYYSKMKEFSYWNLERLIKFHLFQNNVGHLVKEFPYVMYSVRNIDGNTRWEKGVFSSQFGYYIKYESEYEKSSDYKNKFETSGLTMDDFYEKTLKELFVNVAVYTPYKDIWPQDIPIVVEPIVEPPKYQIPKEPYRNKRRLMYTISKN